MSVACPSCGHLYEGHDNVWGKVCNCGFVIEAPPNKMTEENEQKLKQLQKIAIEILRNKLFRSKECPSNAMNKK